MGGLGTMGKLFPTTFDWQSLLVYHGLPLYHPCGDEYPAYPCT